MNQLYQFHQVRLYECQGEKTETSTEFVFYIYDNSEYQFQDTQ